MVINSMSIELHLGERYKIEAFPMFTYRIRINGRLDIVEYSTVEEATKAAENIANHKQNFLS